MFQHWSVHLVLDSLISSGKKKKTLTNNISSRYKKCLSLSTNTGTHVFSRDGSMPCHSTTHGGCICQSTLSWKEGLFFLFKVKKPSNGIEIHKSWFIKLQVGYYHDFVFRNILTANNHLKCETILKLVLNRLDEITAALGLSLLGQADISGENPKYRSYNRMTLL